MVLSVIIVFLALLLVRCDSLSGVAAYLIVISLFGVSAYRCNCLISCYYW